MLLTFAYRCFFHTSHQGTKGGLFSQQLLHSSTYGVPKERASNAKENNRLVREIFLLLLTGMASFSQLVDYNVFAKTQKARQKLISFTDKKGTQHAGWITYVLKILDELARHASDPAKYVGGFSAGKESLPFISWTILEGSLSPLPSVVYSTRCGKDAIPVSTTSKISLTSLLLFFAFDALSCGTL